MNGSPANDRAPVTPPSGNKEKRAARRDRTAPRKRLTSPNPKHPLVQHLRALAARLPDFSDVLRECAEEVNYKANLDERALSVLVIVALRRGLNHEEDICDELRVKRKDLRLTLAALEREGQVRRERITPRGGHEGGWEGHLWFAVEQPSKKTRPPRAMLTSRRFHKQKRVAAPGAPTATTTDGRKDGLR